jgi:hypothetical protein
MDWLIMLSLLTRSFDRMECLVMLSRVQQLEQIFILDSLNETKIRTSSIALQELQRMKVISLNENLTTWQKQTQNAVKVASLNCAGLKPHFTDVQSDELPPTTNQTWFSISKM